MSRVKTAFGAVVVAQAAHSTEEYIGKLWELFPPARFLTGLVSQDLERGFIVINASLVGFGIWCLAWPMRREWPSASILAWGWVVIELINGVGHPIWSLTTGGYTPGAFTALIPLPAALYLARQLSTSQRPVPA